MKMIRMAGLSDQVQRRAPNTLRPELVEGHFCVPLEEQGFDKLSPNG
jgi:hypothetical protein